MGLPDIGIGDVAHAATGGVGKAASAMGKGSKAPTAPDFNAAAEKQAQSERPDQTNAFGTSSQWLQGPDGKWTQKVGLNGQLGAASTDMQRQIGQAWSTPLDNGAQARQHAEDAIYGRETSRLDPRFAQGEQQFQTQMANQGLAPGSEAYDNAYRNFSQSKNDAYQQAQYGAITGGGQEAQRQQGMDLTARMAPEQALAGMNQFNQMPDRGQAAQYLQAAIAKYTGDLQGYGIDQQGKNSTMNGMSNLASTAATFAMMA